MTTRWRLNGRGWALAFALACLTFALLALGAAVPALEPVPHIAVAILVGGGLVLAMVSRSEETEEYDLGPPRDPEPNGEDEDREERS